MLAAFAGMKKAFAYVADKAEDPSVKRLTRGNPTMAAKFDELRNTKPKE